MLYRIYKNLFFSIAILLPFKVVHSQTLPNTFKVENYAEVLPGDSLKVWYNCVGAIVQSTCAEFYRVGKMDPDRIGFIGEIHDYDMQGDVIYKAKINNGYLDGSAYYYYPNGNVKETGQYLNDERTGIWKYYYENGSAEKILNFTNGMPLLLNAYDIKGDILVADGEGNYSGKFKPLSQCDYFTISGKINNGKMEGDWNISRPPIAGYDHGNSLLIAREKFVDGTFISGVETGRSGNSPYRVSRSQILISGFYPNENAQLDENNPGCPGDRLTFTRFKSNSLTAGFYPQLIEEIKTYPNPVNQWIIIGIVFNKSDHIKELNVYSSKNDTNMEAFIYNYIKSLKGWSVGTYSVDNKTCPLLFTINIDSKLGDERVLIPTEYKVRQQMNAMKTQAGN